MISQLKNMRILQYVSLISVFTIKDMDILDRIFLLICYINIYLHYMLCIHIYMCTYVICFFSYECFYFLLIIFKNDLQFLNFLCNISE